MSFLNRFLITAALIVAVAGDALAQTPTPPLPRPTRKGTRYTVKIDSSPQQAAIYLDDKAYGIFAYTPYTGKLVKGDYKLIIELQGYKPAERVIRVDSKNKDFFVPLEKQILPGTLDVQAAADPNVLGAQVFVDGQLEGTAPVPIQVPEGRHLVEVKKQGFADFSQWVSVAQGQKVTLTPVLKPNVVEVPKGSMLVDADVADAEVLVDGQLQADTTPVLIDKLDEGAHIVEVRKAPAVPWKQTVYVKGGQRTKVIATLAATLQQTKGGNVRVLSNVDGAQVYLDGKLVGTVPADLKEISPGEHVIEVKAEGYQTKEDRVTINAGQAVILKMDLAAVAVVGPATSARVSVVSPVPEAEVFIDGARIGTVPVERELAAGEHFVVVSQKGYAKFEQKINVDAGKSMTITAQLRAIGGIRFLANVEGAEVSIDGQVIGKTPLVKEDIDVGEHVVTFRLAGYYDDEKSLSVKGGDLVLVQGELKFIDTGPTPEQLARIRRSLSSFGGRTVPFGNFTVDMGMGYPYWVQARGTVGVTDGWDVGVGFRSLLTTWEFVGTGRYRFFHREPFAFAAFASIGGGGGFDGRNQFILQAGALASITFRELVTVTGRAYLDVWSDRLCSIPETGSTTSTSGPDICTKAVASRSTDEQKIIDEAMGTGGDIWGRDAGAHLKLSMIVEAAVQKTWGVFAIFEGAPFQSPRAGNSGLFHGTLIGQSDPVYNGLVGVTLRF